MTWSEKVRYVRVKLKLTQSELSKATGIPIVTIARWETTNSQPNPKSLGKFVEFCEANNIEFKGELEKYE